jgi:glycine/D-amino acid oxidase-like deaminating enzyme
LFVKRAADVVIIGGDIQGLSLAYHLTELGLTDVCLVEMNMLGSGSSGRSAAIIGFAFQTENCLTLTQLSFTALMRFEEELGVGPDYQPIGCLLLAGPQSAPELYRRHTLLQQLGIGSFRVEWLVPGATL